MMMEHILVAIVDEDVGERVDQSICGTLKSPHNTTVYESGMPVREFSSWSKYTALEFGGWWKTPRRIFDGTSAYSISRFVTRSAHRIGDRFFLMYIMMTPPCLCLSKDVIITSFFVEESFGYHQYV